MWFYLLELFVVRIGFASVIQTFCITVFKVNR